MSQFKVPYDDIKKCNANRGKDIRVTLRSGSVYSGTIWAVLPPKKDKVEWFIQVQVWGEGLVVRKRNGLISCTMMGFKSSYITKFEYLWELETV